MSHDSEEAKEKPLLIDRDNPPPGWWFEETTRGNMEVLIIMFGAFPRGSIEVSNYEEKERWHKALGILNSTSPKS